MPYTLDDKMVIGVSTRALFDMKEANEVFETKGLKAYQEYQLQHENDILAPGPGFGLIKNLLGLNRLIPDWNPVEVVIMSRNSTNTSIRVFNSIKHYGLNITRAALVSGAPLAPYLQAFHTDLFLSAYADDVQKAINGGIAAGIICTEHVEEYTRQQAEAAVEEETADRDSTEGTGSADGETSPEEGAIDRGQIRIAFDGDAVLFSADSEEIYQSKGLTAFEFNEMANAEEPLPEGPFAGFLKKLSAIQQQFDPDDCPIRTALITSRNAPAHERVLRTLRSWNVQVDESLFLGGVEKKEFVKAFGAQIFFDDQMIHADPVSHVTAAAMVPIRESGSGKKGSRKKNTK